MALIKCSECGNQVSDKATTCPHCGAPVENSDLSAPASGQNLAFDPRLAQSVHGLRIDKVNRTFSCGFFSEAHSFDDIIDVDIFENGSSISKTSTGSMLGRAAVGALLGPAGAVIGGVTAKKKSAEIVNSVEVHIFIRSEVKPLLKIKIPIPKKTKKDSRDYNKAITKAKEVVAVVKNLQLS